MFEELLDIFVKIAEKGRVQQGALKAEDVLNFYDQELVAKHISQNMI
jgi:hypothetical protein